MSKTTTKIKINHDGNGSVTFTQDGNPPANLEISGDNNLEIKLGTGFTGQGAKVTSMDLYVDTNHAKGSHIGTWTRDDPTVQPTTDMTISVKGNHILVDDSNATGSDDFYFFGVTAWDGTQSYSSDPELKVKKTSNG